MNFSTTRRHEICYHIPHGTIQRDKTRRHRARFRPTERTRQVRRDHALPECAQTALGHPAQARARGIPADRRKAASELERRRHHLLDSHARKRHENGDSPARKARETACRHRSRRSDTLRRRRQGDHLRPHGRGQHRRRRSRSPGGPAPLPILRIRPRHARAQLVCPLRKRLRRGPFQAGYRPDGLPSPPTPTSTISSIFANGCARCRNPRPC